LRRLAPARRNAIRNRCYADKVMAQLMKAEARKGRQIADEMSETVTWLF
jgi:hypothetical protein